MDHYKKSKNIEIKWYLEAVIVIVDIKVEIFKCQMILLMII